METCTNCGATLRPGARFCTTCGTRVNEKSNEVSGWGTPVTNATDDNQQTSVIEAVKPAEAEIPLQAQDRFRDWGSPTSTADPASNFRSALDTEVQPVEESTWGVPKESASNWNYGSTTDDTWKAPATWGAVTPDATEDDAPAEQDTEVEAVTDVAPEAEEEAIALPEAVVTPTEEPESTAVSLTDNHVRALELVTELQAIIPQLTVSQADKGTAAMTLTEASLQVKDYSDLAATLDAVKENPRDIQVLGDLAAKADRIQELLEERGALADAIEEAIKQLDGA